MTFRETVSLAKMVKKMVGTKRQKNLCEKTKRRDSNNERNVTLTWSCIVVAATSDAHVLMCDWSVCIARSVPLRAKKNPVDRSDHHFIGLI